MVFLFLVYAFFTFILHPYNFSYLSVVKLSYICVLIIALMLKVRLKLNVVAFMLWVILINCLSIIYLFMPDVENYLSYTNILPVTIIGGFLLSHYIYDKSKFTSTFLFLTSIPPLYLLIISPSRYSVLFTIVFLFFISFILYKKLAVLFFSLLLFFIDIEYLISDLSWVQRVEYFLEHGSALRLFLLDTYYSNLSEFLIHGYGLGATGDALYGNPLEYPHNFILEFLSDFGLISLIVILPIIYFFIFISIKIIVDINKKNILLVIFGILSIYYFILFFKSASAYSIYPMLLFFLFYFSLPKSYIKS